MTHDASFLIRPIRVEDAGQVLTLQRAAFVEEALIYRDPAMPALTQTLPQLEAELGDNLGLVAEDGSRIVGAVRALEKDGLLLIGRVATVPDRAGEGIAGALLDALEEAAAERGCTAAELFTGSHSQKNLDWYQRRGYVEQERVEQGDGTAQVFLRKDLGSAGKAP